MPAITFADFSGGLDRRLPVTVQEANRLYILRNAHITEGKRIAKRPGLKVVTTGLTGSVGLVSVNARLKVFVATGATFTPPTAVDAVRLDDPPGLTGGQHLQRVYYASMFQGFMYVVAEYDPSGVYVGGFGGGLGDGASTDPGRPRIPTPVIPGSSSSL